MSQSTLEMAKDLVIAQLESGQLTVDEVDGLLHETHANLMTLKAREDQLEAGAGASPAVALDWRKSISRQAITCLECGSVYKQLSIRHLREHDLNARTYRLKYGIPPTQPLASRATTARRREIVKQTRPWEKAPRYQQFQAKQVAAAAKTRSGAAKRRQRAG